MEAFRKKCSEAESRRLDDMRRFRDLMSGSGTSQRAQYALIQEYTLNSRGLITMI